MGLRYVDQKPDGMNVSSLNSPKAKDQDIKMRMRVGHGTQATVPSQMANSLVDQSSFRQNAQNGVPIQHFY